MKSNIKTLQPNEFLECFMSFGAKRNEIFKKGFELFYIARLQDLRKISKAPVPPVKAITHSLLFLSSGSLSMKIGNKAITIGPNECILISAGQVFSYSSNDNEQSKEGNGFICGFNDNFLIGQIGNRELLKSFEFLTIWGNSVIQPKKQAVKYLTQSLNRIFDEYTLNGLHNKLILQSHLITILCELNVDYLPLSNQNNKTAIEITNHFIELIHQHINIKHKVSDYAAMLNISPNHLNKTVKLITLKSPSVWIRETIINESKILLFQTDLSIQEIASTLGIIDHSYFSRLFKKQEGITPVNFRKMIDLS